MRFTTGMRKQAWNRNVVAVGLASGFMEPLESTSIHLVQMAIEQAADTVPRPRLQPPTSPSSTHRWTSSSSSVRDFIILHYHLNQRSDSPFWVACREMAVPETLTRKMALYAERGRIFRENNELFAEASWLQVLHGQGIKPAGYNPLVDLYPEAEIHEFLEGIRGVIGKCVDVMPSHAAFIAEHCAATPSPRLSRWPCTCRHLLGAPAAGTALATVARWRAPKAATPAPLVVWFTVEGAKGMRRVGERFTAATGVPVVVETPDPADGPSKFQQSSAAGKGPDIYIYAHDRIGEWVAAGILQSVNPGRALRQDIDPLAWQGFGLRGRLWGYPYALEAVTLLYNKALVKTPPRSFDEVIALDAQLARAGQARDPLGLHQHLLHLAAAGRAGRLCLQATRRRQLRPRDTGVANAGAKVGAELLAPLIREGLHAGGQRLCRDGSRGGPGPRGDDDQWALGLGEPASARAWTSASPASRRWPANRPHPSSASRAC
jgi:hypothetical protein